MRAFHPDPGISTLRKRALEFPFRSPTFLKCRQGWSTAKSMCAIWYLTQIGVLDVKSRPVVCRAEVKYHVSMLICVRNWLVQEGAAAILPEFRTRCKMPEVIDRRFPVSYEYMGSPHRYFGSNIPREILTLA